MRVITLRAVLRSVSLCLLRTGGKEHVGSIRLNCEDAAHRLQQRIRHAESFGCRTLANTQSRPCFIPENDQAAYKRLRTWSRCLQLHMETSKQTSTTAEQGCHTAKHVQALLAWATAVLVRV